MSKVKILTIASVCLLLINFVLIGFILLAPHHYNERIGPKNLIINKLELDDRQIQQYEKIIMDHRNDVNATHQTISLLKKELYQTLKQDGDSSKKELLFQNISATQKKMEKVHWNHFIELKALCKDNQLKDFDELANELAVLFTPYKKPHKKK
jgi:protein CpxP